MVGRGWFGGLHTVTGPLFAVRQLQPRASKSCQVWPVPCALVATVPVLAGLMVGLVGIRLHAAARAQAATGAAHRWADLAGDPRFTALLGKVGLKQ